MGKRTILSIAAIFSLVASEMIFSADFPPVSGRGLKIVVAANAPPAVRQAADAIVAAGGHSPLLRVLGGDHPPTGITESDELAKAAPDARAYDNLILVGLSDDILIRQAWQHEAKVIKTGDAAGLYVFGFGNVIGDIGYIESDRNPFLHSAAIPRAPYETEIVVVSGSTPAGVRLAADALVNESLIGGVVASAGWRRGDATLLDRDPLPSQFATPDQFVATAGAWTRVGVIQSGEDEYRGVLEATGIEPETIWRAKYYMPGVWDSPGVESAFKNYHAGLHRRSYANSLWAARFKSEADAAIAAKKIAAAAKLQAGKSGILTGNQPPFSDQKVGSGPLSLWQDGTWVFMSTLPLDVTNDVRRSAPANHSK